MLQTGSAGLPQALSMRSRRSSGAPPPPPPPTSICCRTESRPSRCSEGAVPSIWMISAAGAVSPLKMSAPNKFSSLKVSVAGCAPISEASALSSPTAAAVLALTEGAAAAAAAGAATAAGGIGVAAGGGLWSWALGARSFSYTLEPRAVRTPVAGFQLPALTTGRASRATSAPPWKYLTVPGTAAPTARVPLLATTMEPSLFCV
mmetsp:Transcript_21965/g.51577  ORF Transcript_21965/g.51577 Transcript_21965/m.51577 type:complete len:204 (-) Transcript_21965:635-1246(-)